MKLAKAKFRPLAGMTLLRSRSLEHRQHNLIVLEKQHLDMRLLPDVKLCRNLWNP